MDDRRHERVALSLEVEYRSAGAFLVAYSTNLSKGGMFIETEDPPPIGSEIPLRFTIPGEAHIDVIAVVMWVQAWRTDQRPRGMGVRFEQLEERHGEAIDRIVSSFSGLHVLVMSADRSSREQLVRSLHTIVGAAEIIEAADVETAERTLARECDLVIVELIRGLEDAPGGSPEALLCMRMAKVRQLPVLALALDEEQRQLAREVGADLSLTCLPPLPELRKAVLRLLGRAHRTVLK